MSDLCQLVNLLNFGKHIVHFIVLVLAEAYDPLDPNGNLTIKWDVISWTPDGYVV